LTFFRRFWLFYAPELPDMTFLSQKMNFVIDFTLNRHIKSISGSTGN
jgi:hypothetical protein